MKISVTQEHINAGVPCSDQFCPVAIAIREHLKIDERDLSVSEYEILIRSNTRMNWDDFKTPTPAMDFVRSFDLGENVQPFSFDLDIGG